MKALSGAILLLTAIPYLVSAGDPPPEGWSPNSPRKEIRPEFAWLSGGT